MPATVRIGTCSWADEALSKYFYPPKLPAKERLAWYAEHFDTVEVDSTFYRLPSESMVQGWAERTPDGFTMHIKAFGLMTRHPVKAEVIPEDLRSEMPIDERGRVDRPPRELRGEVFRRFLEALEPLRAAGKLGGRPVRLPLFGRGARRVGRTTTGARRADGTGLRLLQQQRDVRGSGEPARARRAGGDERTTTPPPPRRQPDRCERRRIVDVLSLVHGEDAGAELFGPLVAEAGHRLHEWSFGWATPPPRALDAYDAVLVFGGAM